MEPTHAHADAQPQVVEKTRSSYARLFDTGKNTVLACKIGEMFTHFQSQTIKQGNHLEDYINDFINEKTSSEAFKQKRSYFTSKSSVAEIFEGKKVINKCFIPVKFFDEHGIQCSNKTGTEIDYVVVHDDKSVTLVEMKAGKDFDTKKSAGEVKSLENIRAILNKNGIEVRDILFVSYEALTIDAINIKNLPPTIKKATFDMFLKCMVTESEAEEGRPYIEKQFQNAALENLEQFKTMLVNLMV